MKRRHNNKNTTTAQTLKKQVTIATPPVTATTIPITQQAQVAQVAPITQTTPK
jgi:hypothetical protein